MAKKYCVDEIINDKVVLEDMETCEIINIDRNILKEEITEGNILIFDGNSFKLSLEEEEDRRKIIREKMEKLKALKEKKYETD